MTAPVATLRTFLHPGDAQDRAVAHHVRTVAVCLVAVVLAFHYSLSTLVKTLQLDTPLAYLGLVPGISLVLIARRARRDTWEPPIHDRQVDYIIGVPLLAVAVAINLFLPVRLSAMFWLWRIDLLALPLFASGAIVLLFGVRTLWRLRLPVVFLFLAWPMPYTTVVLRQIELFTNTTLFGVKAGLHLMPGVAEPLAGGDGSLFQIQHGAEGFPVGVASACSGVNGLVGYALVGGAFLFEVSGRWWRRALWLLAGLALVWILNVARILGIFAAGHLWGEGFAIDALHPVLGLILFNVGVIVMLCLLGRFGLSLDGPAASARAGAEADDAGPSLGGPTADLPPLPPAPIRPPVVVRTRLAVSVVLVMGLFCGLANADLKSYDLVANLDGSPRLTAYQDLQGHPLGWRARKIADFGWGKQFFGKESQWYRYDLAWDGITKTKFHTRTHVTVDVVSTPDATRFQTYGVEACYQFHGYHLSSQRTVDLGGVTAKVLSWSSSALDSTWTTVYWMWPVKSRLGTRYERVIFMLNDDATVRLAAKVPGSGTARSFGLNLSDRLGGSKGRSMDARVAKIQDFLLTLAAETIKRQPAASKSR